jgi:hypothetical protein
MSSSQVSKTALRSRQEAGGGDGHAEIDWQSHPSVNIPDPCPYCGAAALHAQHCKRMCLACGWFRSCVD